MRIFEPHYLSHLLIDDLLHSLPHAVFVTEFEELLAEGTADWDLVRVDEATVRREPMLTAQSSLVDDVPEEPTDNDTTRVHVYSGVALLTGRTHYHISPELGKRGVAQFLQHLLVYYPRSGC
jgi:hypothetical protein